MRLYMVLLAAACAAAAWGEIWLGPTAGWTRASGSTGYAETDGKDIGRSAIFWGAAGGYSKGPFYVEGGVSFPPGGSSEGPLLSGWGGERKETSYREFNSHLEGGWRFGEGELRPTVGLSAYWGHATYEGAEFSPWTPRGDATVAVYGRAVNDLFAGPSAGVELWTGPVRWRATGALGYRTHRETGGDWERVNYEEGYSTKGYYPYSLTADFVGVEARLTGRAHVWRRLNIECWVVGRADAFRLGGDVSRDAEARTRRDFTVTFAPSYVF